MRIKNPHGARCRVTTCGLYIERPYQHDSTPQQCLPSTKPSTSG